MALLTVKNGFRTELPGLGKNKSISKLSEKRITTAVRENLRLKYGYSNVNVTCSANFLNGIWKGKCKIYNEWFNYEIKQ